MGTCFMHTFKRVHVGALWENFFSEAKTRKWWRPSLKSPAVSEQDSNITWESSEPLCEHRISTEDMSRSIILHRSFNISMH